MVVKRVPLYEGMFLLHCHEVSCGIGGFCHGFFTRYASVRNKTIVFRWRSSLKKVKALVLVLPQLKGQK